jgi:hypothetical protein
MEGLASLLVGIAAVAAVAVSYVKSNKTAQEAKAQVAEVHILVNSKMTDALKRIEILEAQLKEAREK